MSEPMEASAHDELKEFTLQLLRHIDPLAEVEYHIQDPEEGADGELGPGYLHLEARGPDLDCLLTRSADGLISLEYLLNVTFRRDPPKVAERILLDINGYKVKRESEVRELATRRANEVARGGREKALYGLTPAERRVVHTALSMREDVRTYSEGEGEDRRLIIAPAGAGLS